MRGLFFNAQPTTDIVAHPSGYDREYDSDDFNRYMGVFFGNGVFVRNDPEACKVTASVLALAVAPGIALVDGGQCHFEPGDGLTITQGDGMYSVMCRRNNAAAVRAFELVAVRGEGEYPAPVREGDLYDLCLAHVQVEGSVATVTDTREDRELCGFAALTGQPPYYPPDEANLPYILWLYVLGLPMTPEQVEAVEGNPSLMEIFNQSRIVSASKEEAEAGEDNSKLMTPQRTKEAINARVPVGSLFQTYADYETLTDGVYLACDGRLCMASSFPSIATVGAIRNSAVHGRTLPISGATRAVINRYRYLNGHLFALGWGQGTSGSLSYIWELVDGIFVQRFAAPCRSTNIPAGFCDIGYGNGTYVAVCKTTSESVSAFVYKSTDLMSWTVYDMGLTLTGEYGGLEVAYSDGNWYVSVIVNSSTAPNVLYRFSESASSGASSLMSVKGMTLREVDGYVLVTAGQNGNQAFIRVYKGGGSQLGGYAGGYSTEYGSRPVVDGDLIVWIAVSAFERYVYRVVFNKSTTSVAVTSLTRMGTANMYTACHSQDGKICSIIHDQVITSYDILTGEVVYEEGVEQTGIIVNSPAGYKVLNQGGLLSLGSSLRLHHSVSLPIYPTSRYLNAYHSEPLFALDEIFIPCCSIQGFPVQQAYSLRDQEFVLPNQSQYYIKVKE